MGRVPRRNGAAPSRLIDGTAVIVQTKSAEVTTLDEVGTLVWSSIDGARDEDAITDVVCARFEVDRAIAAADVKSFLDELSQAGLVEFA